MPSFTDALSSKQCQAWDWPVPKAKQLSLLNITQQEMFTITFFIFNPPPYSCSVPFQLPDNPRPFSTFSLPQEFVSLCFIQAANVCVYFLELMCNAAHRNEKQSHTHCIFFSKYRATRPRLGAMEPHLPPSCCSSPARMCCRCPASYDQLSLGKRQGMRHLFATTPGLSLI